VEAVPLAAKSLEMIKVKVHLKLSIEMRARMLSKEEKIWDWISGRENVGQYSSTILSQIRYTHPVES
jgi:hypothetical protein